MKHVRVASLLRQRQPHLHIACCPLYVACRTVTFLLRGARCPLHAASLLRGGSLTAWPCASCFQRTNCADTHSSENLSQRQNNNMCRRIDPRVCSVGTYAFRKCEHEHRSLATLLASR